MLYCFTALLTINLKKIVEKKILSPVVSSVEHQAILLVSAATTTAIRNGA